MLGISWGTEDTHIFGHSKASVWRLKSLISIICISLMTPFLDFLWIHYKGTTDAHLSENKEIIDFYPMIHSLFLFAAMRQY